MENSSYVLSKKINQTSKNRKLNNQIDLNQYISYLINIKIDENEILLIFADLNIFIYELQSLEKVFSKNIFLSFSYPNRIQKLNNNILIVMSEQTTITLIIKKDKNLNKYNIYKGKIFDYSLQSINLIQLPNNNLVLLSNIMIYIFKLKEEKEIEFVDCFNDTNIIKQKLPFYINDYQIKLDPFYNYLDIISMNNDIIVYHNTKYIYVYSLINKQIIFYIEVLIDATTDDVIKKITNEIFCFCGKNIIYFISIKLGMIIKQITLSKYSHIVASQCLNNNNIVFAYLKNVHQKDEEDNISIFEQYNYKIFENNNKQIITIELVLNQILQKNGYGNIFIYELEDGKMITCTNTNIYIYNALTE